MSAPALRKSSHSGLAVQTFVESALHGHIAISLALLDKTDWWDRIKKKGRQLTILTSSFLSIGPSRLDFGPRYADRNDRCASSRSASPSQLVAWQKWLVFQSRAPHEVLILIGALIAPAGKITSVGGADYVYVADSVGQELRYQVTPE